MTDGSVTFGLVHGAWHSGWHWSLFEAELRRRGHRTVAVDLPCEDRYAGASEYADVVIDALDRAGAGDDVVLVGHSLGGLTIPVIAARRPVRHLVFLAAMIPVVGTSVDAQVDAVRDDDHSTTPRMLMPGLGAGQVGHEDGSSSWLPGAAEPILYPDVPTEVAAAATARLRRQCWRPSQETTPLSAWPDLPASYILGVADAVINPMWSREVAAPALGVVPVGLPGGHTAFLARPGELADAVESLVLK